VLILALFFESGILKIFSLPSYVQAQPVDTEEELLPYPSTVEEEESYIIGENLEKRDADTHQYV